MAELSKCDNLDECVAGEEDLNTKNVFSQVLDMVKMLGQTVLVMSLEQSVDMGAAAKAAVSQTSSQRWTVHIFFFLARF